jgi:hypothetical protein
MKAEFTYTRNICFILGVLAAILCIIPPSHNIYPTDFDHSTTKHQASNINAAEMSQDDFHARDMQDGSNASYLEVEMVLSSGQAYHFTVNLNNPQLSQMASEFCDSRAAEFGVDEENIQHGCVEPVLQYLAAQVESATPSNTEGDLAASVISVNMIIEGMNVNFDLDTSKPDSSLDAAKIFCSQYGSQIGVTEASLPLCIDEVQELLEQRVSAEMAVIGRGEQTVEMKAGEKGGATASPGNSPAFSEFSGQVFVTSFPLGSKDFQYKYDMGLDGVTNAASFCHTFWNDLEGAFVEAGILDVHEEKCALIVAEVTLTKVQQFAETLRAAE